MEKSEILKLPIFPKYLMEIIGNEIKYSSAVYVHYDNEKHVEILLQPVVNTHIICKGIKNHVFLESHLKHCLILSKYAIITPEYKETLPSIDIIFKNDKDFLDILHYKYP